MITKHILLLPAILFLGTQAVYSQDTVADWFPVHQGDKWTYQHDSREAHDNQNKPPFEVHQWKTEETTVGLRTIPEGTLLEKEVRVVDGSLPPGWKVDQNQANLIRGNCLFINVDWNSSTHQLQADFRQLLNDGRISADFCFPLVAHKTWGAPHFLWENRERPISEAKDWEVKGIESQDSPAPDKQSTFHITSTSSYLGYGMTADVWFEKGVGVVREDDTHLGAIEEERIHLLQFQPASQNHSQPNPSNKPVGHS